MVNKDRSFELLLIVIQTALLLGTFFINSYYYNENLILANKTFQLAYSPLRADLNVLCSFSASNIGDQTALTLTGSVTNLGERSTYLRTMEIVVVFFVGEESDTTRVEIVYKGVLDELDWSNYTIRGGETRLINTTFVVSQMPFDLLMNEAKAFTNEGYVRINHFDGIEEAMDLGNATIIL